MDIIETRRENLKRWVAKNGTPVKERSLFGQLKTNGSFGEKVARRVERDYRMGNGWLDQPIDSAVPPLIEQGETAASAIDDRARDVGELKLLAVYRLANDKERESLDIDIEILRKRIAARAGDQAESG